MKSLRSFSVVILAAGNSSRMNFPKPFLLFNDGRTFIEKIIDTYTAARINDIILVINVGIENEIRSLISKRYSTNPIKIIINHYPERGRFFSIQLGLQQVNNEFCFLQNIDNPFITVSLLNKMMPAITNTNFVVPVFGYKEGHPVLLSKEIVKHLLSLNGDNNLRNELGFFPKVKLDWPCGEILANINTSKDYLKYFSSVDVIA